MVQLVSYSVMLLNFVILVNRIAIDFQMFLIDFILGRYGFLLPEDQIIPTGRETLAGELVLIQNIQQQVYA